MRLSFHDWVPLKSMVSWAPNGFSICIFICNSEFSIVPPFITYTDLFLSHVYSQLNYDFYFIIYLFRVYIICSTVVIIEGMYSLANCFTDCGGYTFLKYEIEHKEQLQVKYTIMKFTINRTIIDKRFMVEARLFRWLHFVSDYLWHFYTDIP